MKDERAVGKVWESLQREKPLRVTASTGDESGSAGRRAISTYLPAEYHFLRMYAC